MWKRAVHSVNCACLSWAFVKFSVCPSSPFGIGGRMWDLTVLIPDHSLFIYSVNWSEQIMFNVVSRRSPVGLFCPNLPVALS